VLALELGSCIGLLYVPSIMQRSLIGYNSLRNTLVVYFQDITNQLKCIMLIKMLILKYDQYSETGSTVQERTMHTETMAALQEKYRNMK
jgi:hypothetical protein